MITRHGMRFWWLLGLVLWSACTSEHTRTELLVTVASDIAVPAQLDRVTLSVSGQDTARDPEADLREHALPRAITLSHEGGPLGPVQITVRGWLGATLVVENVAEAWFEEGRSVLVPVMLSRACVSVLCESGASCEQGVCVAVVDGGVLVDASSEVDGGLRDGAVLADAQNLPSDADVTGDADINTQLDAAFDDAALVDPADSSAADAGGDAALHDASADAAPVDAATDGATAPSDASVTPPVDAAPPGPGAPPQCTITTPMAGDTYQIGLYFALLGSCTDPETGVLTQGLRWSSPRDGTLGSGANTQAVLQNAGNHTLSLCAPDPRDAQLIGCASVAVVASPTAQPSANILSITQNGSATQPFSAAAGLVFTGTGAGASVTYSWTDDIDGPLGTGSTVTFPTPKVGRHTVTLHVRDRYNAEKTATRSYLVVAAGETNLVSPLTNVNTAIDQAGDPSVAMIASDAALRVYVPSSSGVLFRFDGASLASAAVVAIGQPPLRAMANDAQLDVAHNLSYLATADGLTVCSYASANGVVEPCTSYIRGLLPSQNVLSVLRMQESGGGLDSLLLGTSQGLLLSDTVTGSSRGFAVLRGRAVYDMVAVAGKAVIATDRGLYTLTPSTLLPTRVATDTLPNTALRSLALAADGSLWIASDNGLAHYVPSSGQVTLFGLAQGLGSTQTRGVAVRSVSVAGVARDVIWVATAAGVARLDTLTGQSTRFTTADGLPSNDVLAVHVLANGTKLFGTSRGLGHYIGE